MAPLMALNDHMLQSRWNTPAALLILFRMSFSTSPVFNVAAEVGKVQDVLYIVLT